MTAKPNQPTNQQNSFSVGKRTYQHRDIKLTNKGHSLSVEHKSRDSSGLQKKVSQWGGTYLLSHTDWAACYNSKRWQAGATKKVRKWEELTSCQVQNKRPGRTEKNGLLASEVNSPPIKCGARAWSGKWKKSANKGKCEGRDKAEVCILTRKLNIKQTNKHKNDL